MKTEDKNGCLYDEAARGVNKTMNVRYAVQREARYTLGTKEVVAAAVSRFPQGKLLPEPSRRRRYRQVNGGAEPLAPEELTIRG